MGMELPTLPPGSVPDIDYPRLMSIGGGIALAGFLLAFVWGVSISENTAAGVVVLGAIGAFVALVSGRS